MSYTIPEPCKMDNDCVDGNNCTVDTCNTVGSQCVQSMSNDCCGNFICKAGEYATCSDCGPFNLLVSDPYYGPEYKATGMMFDVEAIRDLVIKNLKFYPYHFEVPLNYSVNLYTASRGWSGIESNPDSWTQIITSQSIITTCEI